MRAHADMKYRTYTLHKHDTYTYIYILCTGGYTVCIPHKEVEPRHELYYEYRILKPC